MKDKLKVITDIKRTTLYLDKIVINFPNTDRVLRDNIMKSIYNALEYCYMANEVSDYNRVMYQKKIITNVKMLDFYFTLALNKKYISYKKYCKVSNVLLNNLKLIYGWVRYEKSR